MVFISFKTLILTLVLFSILLGLFLLRQTPHLIAERGGKILLLFGMFVLPLIALLSGVSEDMHGATKTEFCLTCHEMKPYGQSLFIDDDEVTPAVHTQNRLVPKETACYTCHTNYSLFGDAKAKITGLRHVYVHFFREIPDSIKLYNPYPNANCLSCHAESRKFNASEQHRTVEAPLQDIHSGKVSCLEIGCHDVGHMVHELEDFEFWEPKEVKQ